MKITRVIALFAVCFACSVQAELVWQPAPPEIKTETAAGGHAGHGRDRGAQPFILKGDIDGVSLPEAELWLPTQVRRPLSVNADGKVAVKGTGIGSYHMLFARKQHDASNEVAMRYLHMQGRDTDVSPEELVTSPKAMLDITPDPLTREHQRYLSLKPANFVISYNGEPLAQQRVTLKTTNGSEIAALTDKSGRVSLELPDDFSDVQSGRSNNRPADFVVATSLERDGYSYQTTVSAAYYVNPSHWRSLSGGLLAMFAGVVSGLLVLRRSRNTVGT